MVQGQISYYLLSYSGLTQQIAQVGALARLGQFVGLLLLLNPFLIQPTFARIQNKKKFVSLVFMLGIGLFFLSFLIMISTYLAPKYWLLALGQNYSNLSNQLPLAIISSLFYFFGATIYTVLISRGFTRGQYYYLLIGLLGQIIYVGFFGISSSYDALILNVIPSISYFLIQISLLIVFIKTWKVEE
jgi:O-antigen/teichoic acid export membrane protein